MAQIGDVLAGVSALGHGEAVQVGVHRIDEDLRPRAGVVDVVLGCDV